MVVRGYFFPVASVECHCFIKYLSWTNLLDFRKLAESWQKVSMQGLGSPTIFLEMMHFLANWSQGNWNCWKISRPVCRRLRPEGLLESYYRVSKYIALGLEQGDGHSVRLAATQMGWEEGWMSQRSPGLRNKSTCTKRPVHSWSQGELLPKQLGSQLGLFWVCE